MPRVKNVYRCGEIEIRIDELSESFRIPSIIEASKNRLKKDFSTCEEKRKEARRKTGKREKPRDLCENCCLAAPLSEDSFDPLSRLYTEITEDIQYPKLKKRLDRSDEQLFETPH